MNIVNAVRADTGGQAIRLSGAINALYKGEHNSRTFTGGLNYGKIPYDILYKKGWKTTGFPDEVMDIWKAADVYHLHNSMGWVQHWPLNEMNPKAGIVMHTHGRPSKRNARLMRKEDAKAQKVIRVVSTPGLLNRVFTYNKTARWFPAPVDIVALKRLRRNKRKSDGIIRVVHAPTVNKNTKEFLTVMELIKHKHKKVETVVISRQSQVNAISLKAVGTIHFNCLHHGMGSNVFECMAMSIPSITGNWDTNYPDLIKELHPDHVLPYVDVTIKEDLFDAIDELIIDDSLRSELVTAGLRWVEKYHSFENTTALAIKTYEEAIELRS